MHIEGNDMVHAEAKEAVKGISSKAHNLPEYIKRDKLPLSIAVVRQEFEKELKKR
jgi:hypothetical protein